jgi:hypothetical protein
MNCPNCNTSVGCSCKLRTASDGKKVCVNCQTNYERQLENNRNHSSNNKPLNDHSS